jgi:hypothetical protein
MSASLDTALSRGYGVWSLGELREKSGMWLLVVEVVLHKMPPLLEIRIILHFSFNGKESGV